MMQQWGGAAAYIAKSQRISHQSHHAQSAGIRRPYSRCPYVRLARHKQLSSAVFLRRGLFSVMAKEPCYSLPMLHAWHAKRDARLLMLLIVSQVTFLLSLFLITFFR